MSHRAFGLSGSVARWHASSAAALAVSSSFWSVMNAACTTLIAIALWSGADMYAVRIASRCRSGMNGTISGTSISGGRGADGGTAGGSLAVTVADDTAAGAPDRFAVK